MVHVFHHLFSAGFAWHDAVAESRTVEQEIIPSSARLAIPDSRRAG
jgi:hypothetical protein